VGQEPFARGFHEIENFLETIWAAVVRVGDLGYGAIGGEFQEQSDALAGVCRRSAMEDFEIVEIHGEDEVELLEIVRLHDPGP
jgi:hypothetical protein